MLNHILWLCGLSLVVIHGVLALSVSSAAEPNRFVGRWEDNRRSSFEMEVRGVVETIQTDTTFRWDIRADGTATNMVQNNIFDYDPVTRKRTRKLPYRGADEYRWEQRQGQLVLTMQRDDGNGGKVDATTTVLPPDRPALIRQVAIVRDDGTLVVHRESGGPYYGNEPTEYSRVPIPLEGDNR
jgi:hypothetical protein